MRTSNNRSKLYPKQLLVTSKAVNSLEEENQLNYLAPIRKEEWNLRKQ